MASTERRFMKHEGIQIWEVTDGQTVTYKSDPVDNRIFASSTLGELQARISIINFFGCVKRSSRSR